MEKLSEAAYKKLLYHYRVQLNEIMRGLEMYGQQVIVDGAKEEIIHITEQFGLVVRGKDMPIRRKK